MKVGSNPVDVSLDQETDTVYVANWGNGTGTTVSVIDGRTCNGHVTSGCRQIPATATIGTAPRAWSWTNLPTPYTRPRSPRAGPKPSG